VLRGLMRDKRSQITDAVLQGFVEQIVKADRLLASVAIQDAARAGASASRLAEAMKELDKGDRAVAEQKFEAGIDHYLNAWRHAWHLGSMLTCREVAGGLHVEFMASPGEVYFIEASTNFTDWVTVESGTAGNERTCCFEAPAHGGLTRQFYRVRFVR